jgi:hypothetical protein
MYLSVCVQRMVQLNKSYQSHPPLAQISVADNPRMVMYEV